MKKYIVLLGALISFCSGIAQAHEFHYAGIDGTRGVIIDLKSSMFYFSGLDFSNGNQNESGAELTNCSDQMMDCVALRNIVLAVPKSRAFDNDWRSRGVSFHLAGRYQSDDGEVLIVRSNDQGQEYFFSFSKDKGIRTISLKYANGLAQTYVACESSGLFAAVNWH